MEKGVVAWWGHRGGKTPQNKKPTLKTNASLSRSSCVQSTRKSLGNKLALSFPFLYPRFQIGDS